MRITRHWPSKNHRTVKPTKARLDQLAALPNLKNLPLSPISSIQHPAFQIKIPSNSHIQIRLENRGLSPSDYLLPEYPVHIRL